MAAELGCSRSSAGPFMLCGGSWLLPAGSRAPANTKLSSIVKGQDITASLSMSKLASKRALKGPGFQ